MPNPDKVPILTWSCYDYLCCSVKGCIEGKWVSGWNDDWGQRYRSKITTIPYPTFICLDSHLLLGLVLNPPSTFSLAFSSSGMFLKRRLDPELRLGS